MSSINNDQKNPMKLPQDFEVTPEWIEQTNDSLLLELALPFVTEKTILKNLITDKITYVNEGQRSITSNQLLLSKSEKETGNNFMKSNSLPEAIKHYTFSIISNPKEPTTYCNRALAYFKTGEFQKGILDSTRAISLKNDYIKAFYRRAQCYIELKKYRLAFDDLLYIINIDKSSAEIETYLNKTLEGWKKDTGDNFKKIENLLNTEINKARKKEMKFNPLPWELKKELQESYDKWSRSAEQVKNEIKNQINKKDYIKASEICQVCLEQCNNFIKTYTDRTIHFINILESIEELKCLKKVLELTITENKNLEKKIRAQNAKNHDNFYKTSLLSKKQRDNATLIAEQFLDFKDFGKSAYGFEKAYNSFKDRDEKFLEYMKYFDGNNLPIVYKNSELPVPVIKGIIKCFKGLKEFSKENKEMFLLYMDGITKTKSFGLVKNFIKKADKEYIVSTAENILKEDSSKKEIVENIVKEYK